MACILSMDAPLCDFFDILVVTMLEPNQITQARPVQRKAWPASQSQAYRCIVSFARASTL